MRRPFPTYGHPMRLAVPSATIRRELRGVVIALLLVAATTVVAFALFRFVGIRRGSVIYLLPVLIAGSRLGLISALTAAIAGLLASGYIFFSPYYSFYLAQPQEALFLVLFLIVAVVTSHLANSMKQQTEIAHKRGKEMGDLYAFSRRLAAAPNAAAITTAIEEHLTSLVQRKVVLVGAGIAESVASGLLPEPVHTEVERVRADQVPTAAVKDATGNVWLVRRVSQKTLAFGVIAIDLGNETGAVMADIRQRVDEVLSDAAETLERLGVAQALNEARMRSETELLRDALIGSVSHELRTPLASILGAATVLCAAPALASDERLKSLAQVVRDEAERLNNDIQNLLDASRISHQQVLPRMQWVEPVDIVNSALERRKRRLEGHRVALEMNSELPIIYVDPIMVEQALVQVLDNAAKYSPCGSTINVTARRNGRDVILSVNDSGAGVAAEEKAHLGERFFRGPRQAATTSGSGLGLWIANAFVAANGGDVEVSSPGVDRGTTVSIHLPLTPQSAQPVIHADE
jgi:two-component system sensor histidine kinase KdpD